MKKLYYPLFALAAMAMTTSCQDEVENGASINSNEAVVNFDVQLENAEGSRALIGDGTKAKYLTFAVFKAKTGEIGDEVKALRQQVEVNADLTATVSTRLVKGQTYNFVFWAQSESVPAQDDPATTEVEKIGEGTYYNISNMGAIKVNYTDNKIAANDESRDAFYAARNNLTIKGPITETITLKRPFGQINVGTSIGSLADAAKAEVNIARSKMVISEVATELYPYSGQVGGNAENVEYTIAAIPEQTKDDDKGELTDVAGENYEYLSMNYILVNDQTSDENQVVNGSRKNMLNNVHFYIYDGTNSTPINDFEIPNVPVQRNWRTNIVGDILNSDVTFNIVINPSFDKDENGDDHNYYANVLTLDELKEAVAHGAVITLQADIETEETLVLAPGQDFNGNEKTLTMTKGTSQYYLQPAGGSISGLTIEGYNTRNSNDKVLRGIYIANAKENVVIEGVTVSGVAYPINTGSGIANGLTLSVKNSTLYGWTSYASFASASFENVTFGKSTYGFGGTYDNSWHACLKPYVATTLTGCTFETGFKLDLSELADGAKVTFKNCKVGGTTITEGNIGTLLNFDNTDKRAVVEQ